MERKAALDPVAITQVDKASEVYGPFVGFIPVFIAGVFLGLLLLTIGLRRGRLVPTWTVLTALVAWVATFTPIALEVFRRSADRNLTLPPAGSMSVGQEATL